MKAICIYKGYTKVTTNNQDIRPSVTVKVLLADISWMAGWICTIKLVLESAYQIFLMIYGISHRDKYS